MRLSALLRLAFATAPRVSRLTSPQKVTRRLILQKARRQTFQRLARRQVRTWHSPSTACKHTVSGSFNSLNKGSFHLSLTVLVHYRSPRVFSLGRWTSLFPTGLACPVVLKVTSRSLDSFRLRGSHPLCPAFPDSLTMNQICNFLDDTSSSRRALQPPHDIGAGPLSCAGLGFSPFARHYSGNDLSSSGY